MIMLLKYIQEGLSLGFKVHDTVLRFQISRLSMHVPDGVFDWHDGHRGLLFWGWGMGYSCVCVCVCKCECVCWEVGKGGGGRGEGVTFVFAPLGDSESCMPGPKASAQGADMMWGWPHWGRRGVMLGGEGFFFFRSLRRDRHTFFFLFVRLLTSPNWLYHLKLFPV